MTSYEIIGNGEEKVILLHGWWSDRSCYAALKDFMDLDHFTYLLMDYRGYGAAKDIDGDHTIEEIAGDAIAAADKEGWDKFHVMGHSMGGMTAQMISVMVPDRVSSVVAVTPVPACGSPLDDAGKDLFHNAAKQDGNRIGILKFLTSDQYSDGWYDFVLKTSRATTDEGAFHDYMIAWTETDFADKMTDLKTPCLAIVGKQDQAINEDAMKGTLMQYYDNCQIEAIGSSGHFPMHETPVHLVSIAEAFMKEQ